jgi:hypothetical protein
MESISAFTRIAISGGGKQWKVEPNDRQTTAIDVKLEIQGDDQNGYHLVMTPEGCFTADTWHKTRVEAVEEAERIFGVPESAWVRKAD